VVLNDQQFAGLCRALDLEHLIGHSDYGDNLKRAQHSQELHDLIEGILCTGSRDLWLEVLEQHDVPVAPVLERDEVFQHPQIQTNQMFATQEHPQAGWVEMFNIPIHLSETPGRLRRPAPLLGQHTKEVLRELGYDASRIRRLREQKVIG